MLVLSRRAGEGIVIQDDIVVTVVRVRGSQVHLSFDAPKETTIHRSEIYEKITRQQQTALPPLEPVG